MCCFQSITLMIRHLRSHFGNMELLSVREAWEIGPNDPDAVALKQDEQPLIPDDVKDAPVLRTLTRWAKR
jgi:hypothetical protein